MIRDWTKVAGSGNRTLLEEFIGMRESDRGVVLLGAIHVDKHLGQLLATVMPADLSDAEKRRVLKGPLRAFSARLEVAYACRLIDRTLYDALQALRQIRNDLAHEPAAFDLVQQADSIQRIYKSDYPTEQQLPRVAFDILWEHVGAELFRMDQERHEKDPSVPMQFSSQADAKTFAVEDPTRLQYMRDRKLQMQVAVGVTMICAALINAGEATLELLGGSMTLRELSLRRQKP